MALTPVKRASPIFVAPTLDANGVPTKPWQPTSITRTPDWGVPRIKVNGTDITEFRSKRTIPEHWSFVKPHWYGDATIWVPNLTTYEAPAAWCFKGASVRIDRDLPSGGGISTDPRDPWLGEVTTITDRDGGTELTCAGLYQQADFYRRGPGLRDDPQDVGDLFAFNLDPVNRPAYRWPSSMTGPTTTKLSKYRGNWESVLEYLKAIGALIPGWTLRPDTDFSPLLVDTLVAPGSTWTQQYVRGWVDAQLSSELRGSPNVIYGEGSVNGVEWRRMIATDAGDPIFIPLSASHVVNTLWLDTDGSLLVDAASFDATVLRYEVHWSIPPGMSEDEAVTLAEEYRLRVADPGWAGNIRLPGTSPVEGHLLQIRPDDIYHLKGYRGADRDLHVAEAAFDWNDGAPTASLVVDSNARDLATISQLLGLDGSAPNFDAATNPFARVQIGKDSGIKKDRTFQWDYGSPTRSGSGWVPNDEVDGHRGPAAPTATFPVTGGAWTKKKFLASEADTIARSEIVVTTSGAYGSPGRRFVAIVCANDLSLPPGGVVNPLANGAWESDVTDLNAMAFQQGWGGSFRDPATGAYVVNAAGYGDVATKLESLGDPLTGQMLDFTNWPYTHDQVDDSERQPAYLWLYVYTVGANARCWARFVRTAGQ